ncbi:MAG: hypothetical protein ACT4NV_02025 [Rhodoferax sp.]
MHGRLAKVCGVVLAVLVASQAMAMSLREMRALEKNEVQGNLYTTYYLVGATEALVEAQADALRQGKPRRFCPPEQGVPPTEVRSLFETELGRDGGLYEADMAAQWVLLSALALRFPCAP